MTQQRRTIVENRNLTNSLPQQFIAFTGPPKIVRIWGDGQPIENGTPEWRTFIHTHNVPVIPGSRSIIKINVHQCATSCGFSVPYYDFKGHRPILDDHFVKKEKKYLATRDEKESMEYYWAWKSQLSIDGLPGMKRGYEYAQRNGVKPLKKMVGRYAPRAPRRAERIQVVHLLVVLVLGMVIGGAMALSFVTPEKLQVLREKGQRVF